MIPTTETESVRHSRFFDALTRSGLVTATALETLAETTATADEHAERLVATGQLSRFQADKLLRGQWQGLLLGTYRILSPLGRGGMGIVYLAKSVSPLGSTTAKPLVALKILSPKKARDDSRTRIRFEREMAIGRIIPAHPHIATIFDTGEVKGVAFIAMEYVTGSTVKEVVEKNGPLSVSHAAQLFRDIAGALQVSHNAGLIHRDLKPSNVMIAADGSAKLLDFGFALRIGEPLPSDPTILGGPGYVLGTMDYIAPEQAIDSTAVTAQSDLYSLGATLYYALSGCPPFPGGTSSQKLRWHRTETPHPLRAICPGLPKPIADIVERLMSKRPEDRYADATEVYAVLDKHAVDMRVEVAAKEPAKPVPVPPSAMEDDDWPDDEDNELPVPKTLPFDWDHPPQWVWYPAIGAMIVMGITAGFLARLIVR